MAAGPSHLAGRSVRAKDEALFGSTAARAIAKIVIILHSRSAALDPSAAVRFFSQKGGPRPLANR